MLKILLFNPPHPEGKGFTREGRCTQEAGIWATQWPPVSLATIAAFLEKDGHQIKIIDCPAMGMDRRMFKDELLCFSPDMVFWNTATPTLFHDLDLSRLIKKVSPHASTGVIGTHVTAIPETALNFPGIDMVIRNEPEQTIREICLHPDTSWPKINGISYRSPDFGKIKHNPQQTFLKADAIPVPAWHLLDLTPYRLPLKGRPFLIVAPTRGCPFACSFCTAPLYYGRRLRQRPVKAVVDEIENNITRFSISDFFIWADTFTADNNYVYHFCREIKKRHLKIRWACNSRVDTVNKKLLAEMKSAGLWMISFGLESADNDILEKSGKKINTAQSRLAVISAHTLGLKVSGHFIFGLPGENTRSMAKTLALALELPLDIAQFYAAAPFPGTALYLLAVKKGWITKEKNCSQNQATMHLPDLAPDQVNTFTRKAYRKFYLRPKTLQNLFSMLEPGAITGITTGLKRFLEWILRKDIR